MKTLTMNININTKNNRLEVVFSEKPSKKILEAIKAIHFVYRVIDGQAMWLCTSKYLDKEAYNLFIENDCKNIKKVVTYDGKKPKAPKKEAPKAAKTPKATPKKEEPKPEVVKNDNLISDYENLIAKQNELIATYEKAIAKQNELIALLKEAPKASKKPEPKTPKKASKKPEPKASTKPVLVATSKTISNADSNNPKREVMLMVNGKVIR